MSGGHFDYAQYRLHDIAEGIKELIETNNDETVNEWNEKNGGFYSDKTIAEFKKAVEFLEKAEIYVQRIDWLVSGDDGEETFHNRLQEDLNRGLRSG